jgi:hypothetical protein
MARTEKPVKSLGSRAVHPITALCCAALGLALAPTLATLTVAVPANPGAEVVAVAVKRGQ